jgi:5-(carboxyamino)imidazole ribonucleotide mutase
MAETTPLVGIAMGSDSDLPTMGEAAEALAELGIPHEVRIISAHRTPDRLADYGTQAAQRGLKVLVAGAGGAAHLPGMLAAYTTLPVIGVPVAIGHLQGVDALLSIVQMPKGVPVATVAIGAARNAGLLAARILATADDALAARLADAQREVHATVVDKDERTRARYAGGGGGVGFTG